MSKEGKNKQATRRRRWRRCLLVLALVALSYLGWQTWDIHHFGHHDEGSSADCAIVLGAAAWHNKPSPVFTARIDHAIQLYQQDRVDYLLLTGGFGKDAPFAESEVARDYCLKQGVPKDAILMETNSTTTAQNLKEARELMTERGLRSALVVSDPWHLKRACAMAEHAGIEAKPSATTTTKYKSRKAKLGFLVRELYYFHLWKVGKR